MKTRARKGGATGKPETQTTSTPAQQLQPSVQDPPQVFIWPKDTSSLARVVTLPNPVTSTPSRYLLCPEKGCFEFTKIAAPKHVHRSWLLAPSRHNDDDGTTGESDEGYVLQTPDLLVATPIDPLFLILPWAVRKGEGSDQNAVYMTTYDYVQDLISRSPHLERMLQDDGQAKLRTMLEKSLLYVCDTMAAGDEVCCKLSVQKLVDRLVRKAQRMVEKGLPASMEERFVKQALAVPVMSIRREESSISLAREGSVNTSAGAETESTGTSQDTQTSDDSVKFTSTAATSVAPTPPQASSAPTQEVLHLLRLRTALNFMVSSYVPSTIRARIVETLAYPETTPIDFASLDDHLKHLAKLKQEAQALRSLSDNISRKRSAMDDDEAIEKSEAKKRKKDEEEARKKNVTHGVKKLAKADRSGMKSISSFFVGKPGGKK